MYVPFLLRRRVASVSSAFLPPSIKDTSSPTAFSLLLLLRGEEVERLRYALDPLHSVPLFELQLHPLVRSIFWL